jgi:hypothetical protein
MDGCVCPGVARSPSTASWRSISRCHASSRSLACLRRRRKSRPPTSRASAAALTRIGRPIPPPQAPKVMPRDFSRLRSRADSNRSTNLAPTGSHGRGKPCACAERAAPGLGRSAATGVVFVIERAHLVRAAFVTPVSYQPAIAVRRGLTVMWSRCNHGCRGGGARRGGALPPAGERPMAVVLTRGAANRACVVVRRQAEAEDGGDGPRRDSRRRSPDACTRTSASAQAAEAAGRRTRVRARARARQPPRAPRSSLRATRSLSPAAGAGTGGRSTRPGRG